MRTLTAPLVVAALLASPAAAEKPVPERQLPKEVVAGLRLLEHEFNRALARDCAPERCYSKGCLYVAHAVVDQPTMGALPGLRLDPKPSSSAGQVYLTTAECGFAHEKSVRPRDASALATRLAAKLSRGWMQVDVTHEKLLPIPDFMREAPADPLEDEPPAEAPPEAEPDAGVSDAGAASASGDEEWRGPVAGRELWVSLLPHFAWMIALVMLTFAALVVIWGARRLGRQSPEEQLLMAQLMGDAGSDGGGGGQPPPEVAAGDEPVASEQLRAWRERLAKTPRSQTDPALQALVTDLLRSGERKLLAKAVMLFPDEFPKAFPTTGALASAKFEVATLLKNTDPRSLPSDALFFDKLNRYALASLLTAHPDTDLIRGLHDDFGAAALGELLGAVQPRYGALLFALAPGSMQHEAVGLFTQAQLSQTVDQLLRSNRIDPAETEYLLEVLAALRANEPIPAPPAEHGVSDRGAEFGATAALSILLPRLDPEVRAQHVAAAAARLNGRLPTWINGTLYAEMLLELDGTTRNDLLLEVDVDQLAAWLQVQTEHARAAVLDGAPMSLRAALSAVSTPSSAAEHYALVGEGRAALSAALQRRLLRGDIPFQALLA